MRSSISKLTFFCLATTILLVIVVSSCRPASETNTNANVSVAANTNTTAANVNANSSPAPLSGVNTREPEKYRATLVFSAETAGGEKTIGIPTLSADVARSGDDRRVSFKLPDGSELIYIDHDNHHYAVVPSRKQYAELTPEAVGFQIQKLMTPGQLVSYIGKLKGVERVGDDQVNGRTADKYRYATTVKTGTQAGDVNNQAFIYIDKETGLPLRAELFAESSGNVKGMNSAKIVAEMRNISTDVDPTQFTVPAGLNKIPPEQIRQQIDAVTGTATAVIKALLSNLNTGAPTGSATPSASASPSASKNP
jgi:outer membrane lipoprotein-sorting protein